MKYRTVSTIPHQRFYDVFAPSMRPEGWDGHACVSVIEDTAEVRIHEGFTVWAAMPYLACDLDQAAMRCVEAMRDPRNDWRHWAPLEWWNLAAHGISPAPTKAITTATAEDAYLRQGSLL